jgi:hypothetical protein
MCSSAYVLKRYYKTVCILTMSFRAAVFEAYVDKSMIRSLNVRIWSWDLVQRSKSANVRLMRRLVEVSEMTMPVTMFVPRTRFLCITNDGTIGALK